MYEEEEKDVVMEGEDHPMAEDVAMNGIDEHDGVEEDDNDSSSGSLVDEDNLVFVGNSMKELRRPGLLPTGCCYDDRMKLHVNVDWSPHPHHPEDPRRIEEIFNAFKKAGLVYTGPEKYLAKVLRDTPTKYMWRIATRDATREEITLVHHPTHYSWVEALSKLSYEELRRISKEKDAGRDSLYVGSMSFGAALLSAGGAIESCKHVVEGTLKNAFAIIRPPGHHAEFDRAMGFCFFNNVPVAVKVCQREYPETCRRVLILDWDVHHGNGVQNIFYQDPNVLYISLHVYADGSFYPGKPDNPMMPDGGMEHCGTGPGLGMNVNIGWKEQGMGDGEYMAAFQKIVMPIGKEFNPDLVVISAGFDAADGDDLGGCFVSPACYAHMTHMLMSLADGKVVVCLEGGYNLEAIAKSATAVAQTLMGEPPPRMHIPNISKEAARLLSKCQAYQAPYWECMRQGVINSPDVDDMNASRLHDVIRSAQRRELLVKHKMTPVYLHKESLWRVFDNQVLITPRFNDSRHVLIIIHDP
jgi:histone deacetylase 6